MRLDDRETHDVNELYAAEINRVCILRVTIDTVPKFMAHQNKLQGRADGIIRSGG